MCGLDRLELDFYPSDMAHENLQRYNYNSCLRTSILGFHRIQEVKIGAFSGINQHQLRGTDLRMQIFNLQLLEC